MSFSVRGGSELDKLEQLGPRLKLGIRDAAHMAGNILVRQAHKGILSGTKSGRLYGAHQASAPGEYSAKRKGEHLRSINYRVSGADYLSFFATAKQSGFLEDGTRRMQPRGDLGNAIRDSSAIVQHTLVYVSWRKVGV
jgi:hypothetical protein